MFLYVFRHYQLPYSRPERETGSTNTAFQLFTRTHSKREGGGNKTETQKCEVMQVKQDTTTLVQPLSRAHPACSTLQWSPRVRAEMGYNLKEPQFRGTDL